MKLARAVHLDESDMLVFDPPARTGEWCVSGGFAFSNWSEDDLDGKARQAFANGWLGLETFGRVTFVAVTRIEPGELDRLCAQLADHFVERYGAPDADAARPVALDELTHMAELCDEHDENTMLIVSRELTSSGVREAYRVIPAREAGLEQFALHVSPDE